MAFQDPAHAGELLALAGTRDPATGLRWPAQESGYFDELLAEYWHLIRSIGALGFRIERDDSDARALRLGSGRATIDGATLSYSSGDALTGTTAGVIDLSAHTAATVYVALVYDGSSWSIAEADASWPSDPHIKLAEVTVASSAIAYDAIVDRRGDQLMTDIVGQTTRFELSIETQGDTGSPSRVHVQAEDLAGTALAQAEFLRARVCDDGAYADATNATIAAAGSTSSVETLSANKDLVLKSSAAGLFEIDLTDATAETVTLRIGPAPVGARRGDYSPSLDVTHAAP